MKIGVKNFRSLKDTSLIEIKPITLLIGKNSSGKSSFIRMLPMLKQSAEERSRTPILLYGDYVDFGSYADTRPKDNTNNKDHFELTFAYGKEFADFATSKKLYGRNGILGAKVFEDISLNLLFNENEKNLIVVERIRVSLQSQVVEINVNTSDNSIISIKVNGLILIGSSNSQFKLMIHPDGGLIPEVLAANKSDSVFFETEDLFLKMIENTFKKNSQIEFQFDKFYKAMASAAFESDAEFLSKLQKLSAIKGIRAATKNWKSDSIEAKSVKGALILYHFFGPIHFVLNMYSRLTFSNVKYLAPVRATAERYYRIQHLSINDVDPNGKNLPVFLDSLTDIQLQDFQDWTFANFQFKTNITKTQGHYSIIIVHSDSDEVNLSDTGFGYSQILPILTQLWFSARNFIGDKRFYYNSDMAPVIIAIEQPELHLHPNFQAKFADALAKILILAKNNGVILRLIIETHSEVIINRIGHLILEESLTVDDINLIVFNKAITQKVTEVTKAYYKDDGTIDNWPIGFFTPEI